MKNITIGIVAHVDAGKTTITEQLLYHSGVLRQKGSVDEGTTQTDCLEIERKRGISVRASSVTFQVKDVKINLIDTPGHVDFIAEVERSLMILDVAILVISAVEGIQSQTELLLEALKSTKTKTIVFINKLDRQGSYSQEIIAELKQRYFPSLCVITQPQNEGEKDCSVLSLSFSDANSLLQLYEQLAEIDEAIMENYLSEIPPKESLLKETYQNHLLDGSLVPVLCGSGMNGIGIEPLMNCILQFADTSKQQDSLSGLVYQITHDKSMGRIAHVRLFGGMLKTRDSIQLAPDSIEEKITQIRQYNGLKYHDIGEAHAGDVVALCGLSQAKVGDIIGALTEQRKYQLSAPLLRVRVSPSSEAELTPLIHALSELSAEDPQLDMEFIPEEKEILLSITGVIQLEILSAFLLSRYQLSVIFSEPTVIYKETPLTLGIGFEAYTMPKPCWAVIKLAIEPLPRGSGLIYEANVSNDKLYYRYQNHIATMVPRALKQGLYNWEVTDLKVTLIDGEHHIEHTHPMDFFLATPLAVMDGLRNTGTTLLEPIQAMRISVQEEQLGKVIGDILSMRGSYDSPVITNGFATIEAKVPVATSLHYAVRLASISSGKGVLSTRLLGYEPCSLEDGMIAKRRGVNPLDRDKWILNQRNAL